MSLPFAFFDTCSRVPNQDNSRFVMARKMSPVEARITEILAVSAKLGAPVLSTVCLGLQRHNPGMSVADAVKTSSGEVGFVRLDATPEEVADALTHRTIVIERLSCATPEENVVHRTFDAFTNPHTEHLVRALGERHWLLFGAGFEHCLLSVAEGLRTCGQWVTILEDGCIHGGRSTPETFRQAMARLHEIGADWATFATVLELTPSR